MLNYSIPLSVIKLMLKSSYFNKEHFAYINELHNYVIPSSVILFS